jgi:hypothetical protein
MDHPLFFTSGGAIQSRFQLAGRARSTARMRDWLLVVSPIAAVIYFLAYPHGFHAFMDWFGRLVLQ